MPFRILSLFVSFITLFPVCFIYTWVFIVVIILFHVVLASILNNFTFFACFLHLYSIYRIIIIAFIHCTYLYHILINHCIYITLFLPSILNLSHFDRCIYTFPFFSFISHFTVSILLCCGVYTNMSLCRRFREQQQHRDRRGGGGEGRELSGREREGFRWV